MKHKYNIGQLVELDNGVRLLVRYHPFDESSRYALGHNMTCSMTTLLFRKESALSPVHNPTYREPS